MTGVNKQENNDGPLTRSNRWNEFFAEIILEFILEIILEFISEIILAFISENYEF